MKTLLGITLGLVLTAVLAIGALTVVRAPKFVSRDPVIITEGSRKGCQGEVLGSKFILTQGDTIVAVLAPDCASFFSAFVLEIPQRKLKLLTRIPTPNPTLKGNTI